VCKRGSQHVRAERFSSARVLGGSRGGGERSGLRLAFGKAVVDETELDVPFDHAATLEQPEDAHAGSVQEVCDDRVGQRGEPVEIAQRAAVEAEHAVGKEARDSAEQVAVVGDASARLERQGENPLPEWRATTQDVIDPVRRGLHHRSTQTRRTPRASLARKRDQDLLATFRALAWDKSTAACKHAALEVALELFLHERRQRYDQTLLERPAARPRARRAGAGSRPRAGRAAAREPASSRAAEAAPERERRHREPQSEPRLARLGCR
jgi:hypothetical protein